MLKFMRISSWVLVSLSLALTGCMGAKTLPETKVAEAGNRPLWISNPPSKAGYAYGVGSSEMYGSEARALETAKKQAKADLLATLKVEIESSTLLHKQARMEFQGATQLQESLNQTISSRTPAVELSGIQTLETWVNPNSSEAWALAELNTQKAANQLLLELEQLETQVLKRGTLQGAAKLERVRHVKPSLEDLVQRDKILEQLAFLGALSQTDKQRQEQIEQTQLEIARLLASLGVQLHIQGEAAKLESRLAQALTDLGFNLVQHSPDLNLNLNAKSNQLSRDGLFYVHANADTRITDSNNRGLHVINASTRGVSSAASTAESAAFNDLAQQLAKSLIDTLYSNL